MMDRAAALGLAHAVQFTGRVPHGDVPSLLSAADIAVAPYPGLEQDLWFSPLKVFEYMATGLAIVATDVGQIRQVLRQDTSGLLVPPGDAASMAAALQRLLADDDLRRRSGGPGAARCGGARTRGKRYLARLEDVLSPP